MYNDKGIKTKKSIVLYRRRNIDIVYFPFMPTTLTNRIRKLYNFLCFIFLKNHISSHTLIPRIIAQAMISAQGI